MTRIAIVHEWLNTYGGSERLLSEILEIFPDAQLHALIHNPRNFQDTPLEGRPVKTTFLQKIPRVEDLYRGLLPLMPLAIESLDLRSYDLVVSLSHAVAHGAKTRRGQFHVSYISTPMRYAWHMQDDYLRLHRLDKPVLRSAARLTLSLLRRWDVAASARSDSFLANSRWTASHIREAWKRDAQVIYPPVDVERFDPNRQRDGFYLVVSRLVPYKMVALVVETFNQLGLPLIVVGDGPQLNHLRNIAKENVSLLGHQSDETVADLMSRAKAFLHVAIEDFGIAMVEAQAAGCPVIALNKGGASEIVLDGETGLLIREQNVSWLMEAIEIMEKQPERFDNRAARENSLRFSRDRFRHEFTAFISRFTNGQGFPTPATPLHVLGE